MANTENTNNSLKISEEVIAKIVTVAISETPGVTGYTNKAGDAIIGKLNRRNSSKGIKVEVSEDGITINASISVAYGANLTEVGSLAQENIAHEVESMTGLNIKAVNVIINGITFEEEKNTNK